MEVNFDLHKYITAFDNVIPKKTLETLKKICINHKDFESATVIGGGEPVLNENIRRVKTWGLNNIGTNSLTEVLWCNYLLKHLKTCVTNYLHFHDFSTQFVVNDIQILKYTPGGRFYFHPDHKIKIPSAFSFIFLDNEDYKGGELCFKYPKSDKITTIDKKENRMIIWPSNFLYPHCVKPVTEGERYSVVAWAL